MNVYRGREIDRVREGEREREKRANERARERERERECVCVLVLHLIFMEIIATAGQLREEFCQINIHSCKQFRVCECACVGVCEGGSVCRCVRGCVRV